MLTPFDEMPVHQTPYPFSVPASTDVAFDDGYYFGVFSADQQLFLFLADHPEQQRDRRVRRHRYLT
jgi:hypothetical protein